MKTINLLCSIAIVLLTASCTEQNAEPQEEALSLEQIQQTVQSAYWHVAGITKTENGVTTQVTLDTAYERSRDQVFFEFLPSGRTQFYTGGPSTLPDYPAPAKIFSLIYRIARPVNIEYYWDETMATYIFRSVDVGGFEIIPIGEKTYLDKSTMVVYQTLAEVNAAKASTSMQLVSIFKENQPGEIKYTYTLKRLMHVQFNPNVSHLRDMVEY
ncbi:hypothetical protein [Dyadobacter tibetensis]|uniref:hypothetical protein n=1 Tax=Dyadobacter tibetensis TaxID=1211851 RepID=UPI0004700D5B|nr:hypothetical protein [Dyadobacter tibetensis]